MTCQVSLSRSIVSVPFQWPKPQLAADFWGFWDYAYCLPLVLSWGCKWCEYLCFGFSPFYCSSLFVFVLFFFGGTSVSSSGQMCIFGQSSYFYPSHYGVSGIIFTLWVKSCSSLSAWIICYLAADVSMFSGSRYPSSMHDILLFILDFRLSLQNKYVIFRRKIDIYE